ncbi:hypothetical protein ACWDKQ_10630 [Saccharopolyspora sp. NPDC000995]
MRSNLGVDLSLADLVELTEKCAFRLLRLATAKHRRVGQLRSPLLRRPGKMGVGQPRSSQSDEVRALADEHRATWLRGYRGARSFAYLVLTLDS